MKMLSIDTGLMLWLTFFFAKHFSQNNFSSGVARQAKLMTTSFVFTPFIYQGIINAWTMS